MDIQMNRPHYIVLYYTRRLRELRKLQLALKKTEIPFNVRESILKGTSLGFPITPAHTPTTFWSILVPNSIVQQAQEVLWECGDDFLLDPLIEEFATPQWMRTLWRYYSIIFMLLITTLVVVSIITFPIESGSLL